MAARHSRSDMAALRRRMQMIFQDPFASLNPRWRVFDIIAEPIRAFGLSSGKADLEKRVGELLRQVGLTPADGAQISARILRRPAPAHLDRPRARRASPEFLVCDEPTSALDVSVQAQILNLMNDLQRAPAAHLSVHLPQPGGGLPHLDRVGVMYLGRLVEVAPTETLFRRPKHPYTRLLLDTIPDLDMTGRQRTPVAGEVPSPINPPPGCTFHPRCPFANERCQVERPKALPIEGGTVACHAIEEGRLPVEERSYAARADVGFTTNFRTVRDVRRRMLGALDPSPRILTIRSHIFGEIPDAGHQSYCLVS